MEYSTLFKSCFATLYVFHTIQFWQNPNNLTSFSPKKNRQFSREIKVEFLDKKMKISNSMNNSQLFELH